MRAIRLFSIGLLAAAAFAGSFSSASAAPDEAAVAQQFAEAGEAKFADALAAAKALDAAIDALIETPDEDRLKAARAAWIEARVPYLRSEVYRFGNPVVDDWEGKVNAWPLDEGLIDYVDESYGSESDENALFTANVIANRTITIDGKEVDAGEITPELLATRLHNAGGVDANVAIGYHAIEFLLWGQDLNGTGPGAGPDPPPITTGRTAPAAIAIAGPPISRPHPPCSCPPSRRFRRNSSREARPQGSTRTAGRGWLPCSPAWAPSPMANWPASA